MNRHKSRSSREIDLPIKKDGMTQKSCTVFLNKERHLSDIQGDKTIPHEKRVQRINAYLL